MADTVTGHDEDGDGIPDVIDKCPQIAGTNADADGDGVGDACDPNPSVPTEHFLLFATMQPGDNPFDTNNWMQKDDSLFGHVGPGSPTSNNLFITRPFGTVRIDIRFELTAINGLATDQHQVAAGIERPDPYYFAELNDNTSGGDVGVFSYSMANGYQTQGLMVTPRLHTGTGVLRIDANTTSRAWQLEAGWTGEVYDVGGATPSYDGGTSIIFADNNLDLDLTSVTLVETQ